MNANTLTKSVFLILFSGLILKAQPAKAELLNYLSGCMTAMGAGLAGTGYAATRLDEGQRMNTQGYVASGAISCLVGMGYVAISGAQAEFSASYKLKEENENLAYQYRRLAKERCLLKESCTPGGNAIIVDTDTEIKKQGDKVFETSTSTIEANE